MRCNCTQLHLVGYIHTYQNGCCMDTLGVLIEPDPKICLFHWRGFFYSKKQNFQCQDYSPQVPDYQDFLILRQWILEIYVYTYTRGSNSSVEDKNASAIMQQFCRLSLPHWFRGILTMSILHYTINVNSSTGWYLQFLFKHLTSTYNFSSCHCDSNFCARTWSLSKLK
jgi:hypothetical protein